MQKYVYIVIHDVVCRVMRFARNIKGLDSQKNKYQFAIKFSLKIGMGMDNPVTDLTIK